jgi:D-aminoacyl-tRNA deacylase
VRAVVQRVSAASVLLKGTGETTGTIGSGILAYIGVMKGDTPIDLEWMAEKLSGLRIFQDDEGKMNRSVSDIRGELLLVSQFTLGGDARKGRRPSFNAAEDPGIAEEVLSALVDNLSARGHRVATGRFGAGMTVRCDVDGPVTILLDSKKTF